MTSYEELSSIIRSRAEVFADEHASVGSECTPMEIGYMGGWKDAIAHFSAIYPEVTIKHESSSITEAEVEAVQKCLYERTLTWVPTVEVRAALNAARRDEES